MPKVIASGVVLSALFLWIGSSDRSTAQEQPRPTTTEVKFDGKFILVNYRKMGEFSGTILRNVRESRLGNRGFLVGEFAVEGRGELADFQGVEEWIPLENVDGLMVFADQAAAGRVAEKFMKAQAGAAGR